MLTAANSDGDNPASKNCEPERTAREVFTGTSEGLYFYCYLRLTASCCLLFQTFSRCHHL